MWPGETENGINLILNAYETTSRLQDQSHHCPTYFQNHLCLLNSRDDGDHLPPDRPGQPLQGRLLHRPRLEAQPDPDQVQLCAC